MKFFHMVLAATFSMSLAACVTHVPTPKPKPMLTDPQAAASETRISHDEFKKITTFLGANASEYNTLRLRAWKQDSDNSVNYQIYLTSFYNVQWRFYNEAYDSKGSKLDFVSIDRKVSSCSGSGGCYYEETVGLNVTRKYLEENQDTGIRYKISGKAGEAVGFLPAAYIKGFLISFDKS